MVHFQYDKIFALFRLGAISHSQLISWADSIIEKSLNPDYWFIELSMSSNLSHLDLESLLSRKLNSTGPFLAQSEFLGSLSYLFFSDIKTPKQTIAILYNEVCLSDHKEYNEIQPEVYMIDDLFDWNENDGIEELRRFLKRYRDDGKMLIKTALA